MTELQTLQSTLSLGIESISTPYKIQNETNFQTSPSLQYSDFSQSSKLLKMDSDVKSFTFIPIKESQEYSDNANPQDGNQRSQKMMELFMIQKLVKQAFFIFDQNDTRIKMNEEIITKFKHQNKLLKGEALHQKNMVEDKKVKIIKGYRKLKIKRKHKQQMIKEQIYESKQRTITLYEQIRILKQEITQQKLFNQQIRRERYQKTQIHSPFNYCSYQDLPNEYYLNYAHQTHLFPFVQSQMPTPQSGRSGKSYPISYDSRNKECFSSNKNPQNKDGTIMDQIAIKYKQMMNKKMENKEQKLLRSSLKMSGKWQNNGEEEQVLQILTGSDKSKKLISSSHKLTPDSPSNIVHTPHFPIKKSDNQVFSAYHERLSNNFQSSVQMKPQIKYISPEKTQNKRNSGLYFQQSKVNLDYDESLSSISKISASKIKKNVEQFLKQQLPMSTQKKSTDSSFDKVAIDEQNFQASTRPLSPPPLLKNLRKVTEQESDLFDSTGGPHVEKKKKNNEKQASAICVEDIILDSQNLKTSQVLSLNTCKNSPSKIEDVVQEYYKIEQKKPTEEDDDEDFLKVNLTTISKISKQKQSSQNNFKNIEASSQDNLRKSLKVSKNGNISCLNIRGGSQMPIVEEQPDFHNQQQQKLNNQKSRLRKSSGTRFLDIIIPKLPTSESQEI